MCLYADFSLLPFHTAFYLLFLQFHGSLHPPPCSHTHSVFKSKASPCVMQAVSPPSHFYLPPLSFSLLSPPPPQNVWIDLNGVIVTALPAVCPSTSASQLLWKVWREQREEEGKRQSKREGKVLLNNKAWRPSREPSLASGVSLSFRLSLFLYLCLIPLILPHCLFRQHIPCTTSHLHIASISRFELALHILFLPLNLALTCSFLSWANGGGGLLVHRRDKTSKSRPLIYPGGVALRLRRFMVVSHVVAFKGPGFKNVGHLK